MMIIKCRICKREFDKPSYRNQHEKDAHPKPVKTSKSVKTSNFDITFEELFKECEAGKFDTEYAEFLDKNADLSVMRICNGDDITKAMESGYLFSEFVNYLWSTMFKAVAV